MDMKQFIEEFQDHLAPKLDAYEQAMSLYIFRHSRLLGKDEVVVASKSARSRMACGVGEKGRPMSEGTAYVKLQSLTEKGCLVIISSERSGRRLRLNLPSEIPGLIPPPGGEMAAASIEEMDFFTEPANRALILHRDQNGCFYCLRALSTENYVIEHVISRPTGNNGYRNLVAACRECNNRKSDASAEDYLRGLYRDSFLTAVELQDRLLKLCQLKNGELKPTL